VLQALALGAFGRVQRVVTAATGAVSGVWHGYVDLRRVREENLVLRQEVADLKVRVLTEHALAERTAGLAALLELKTRVALPTVAANVIAGDATPGFQTITIDRGAANGVRRDMAVIGPSGVIGRIVGAPSADVAQVQLIIGKNAAAGALIERTRAGGVVTGGAGDPPLVLEYVSNFAEVREGDWVVTSGIDGIYPKGFPIGQVESAELGPTLDQVIRVRPVVDFSSLEEVLVVLVPAIGAGSEEPS
jgi:rod shape-determining protein MreC